MKCHPRQYWRNRYICAAFAALTAMAGVLPSTSLAQTPETKPNTIRPEVAAPVKAAEELMAAKKFQEALAKLREADAVADRTPFEIYVIERTRGVAAVNAGDLPGSLKSFEVVVGSGFAPAAEQLKMVEGLARNYYRIADYAKAAQWVSRYYAAGGTDPQLRELRVRALYLGNDFATAATELRQIVDAAEKAGSPPTRDDLQMLGSCYGKLNDSAGYDFALDKLLAYYPTKEYWADAIQRVEARPGLPEWLVLDVFRLAEATGNLSTAEQYVAMAQLALKAGYPAEAKRVVDRGFAAGALGSGPDADAQRRLRDSVARQAADDEKTLAQNARQASAAKDGMPLVNVGYAMVSAGQFAGGLSLMEQGIQKGVGNRLEEARLHLAIAYLAAGEKAKAVAAFKSVQGGDGSADLARLWAIRAQSSAS
jgi:tetratricopeptide (TPR) repeat protein